MDKIAAKGEKSVFRNLFGRNSDSEDSSSDEEALKDVVEVNANECTNTMSKYSSSSGRITIDMYEEKLLGIAHQLWPAAKFMCSFLENQPQVLLDYNKSEFNVLELGAGVGLCGLFISKLCCDHYDGKANIILTDLAEAVGRLQQNIELNGLQSTVTADVLSWGNDEDFDRVWSKFTSPPLVIAADCVYWECLFQPLFSTMKRIVDNGGEVIMSHVKRWKKDTKFFNLCKKNGMLVDVLVEEITMIPNENTGELNKQITRVYRIKKDSGGNSATSVVEEEDC